MSQHHLSNRPDEVALDLNQRILQIKWQDGHLSQYGFDYLRHKCPCAECRQWTQGVTMTDDVPERLRNASGDIASAQDVHFVGAYSLTIRFADGHDHGIYTWQYLRGICPCGEHEAG